MLGIIISYKKYRLLQHRKSKIMQRIIFLFFTIIFSFNIPPIFAQELNRLPVALHDLFNLADSNSRNLKVSAYKEESAAENVQQQKNLRRPSIDASLSVSHFADGIVTDRNFSHKISAEIPDFGNNFALNSTQVIYAGSAIKTSIKTAQLSLLVTQLDKQKDIQDIRFLIAGYYLELQKIENQTLIIQHSLQQTEKLLLQIQNKFNQGTALKNAITRYELQKQSLELSLLKLENGRKIINNELVTTLLLPKGTLLEIKNETEINLDTETIKPTQWLSMAHENAPVIKQMGIRVTMAKQAIKLSKAERSPQIFLFASDVIGGPIFAQVPPLNKNLIYLNIGAGIKYNIASIYQSRSKIKASRVAEKMAIENDALVKELLLNDIESAAILYQEAKDVYQTQLKSVQLANENYKVVRNRYLDDLVLITEMLDAENSKIDAEMQAANAQINILFHFYQLNKLSGTL
jgi:outer membrane protein